MDLQRFRSEPAWTTGIPHRRVSSPESKTPTKHRLVLMVIEHNPLRKTGKQGQLKNHLEFQGPPCPGQTLGDAPDDIDPAGLSMFGCRAGNPVARTKLYFFDEFPFCWFSAASPLLMPDR